MITVKKQKLKYINYLSDQIHTEVILTPGTIGNVLTSKYLFICLGIILLVLGTIFFLIGAKLILPFFGIELLLLYISYQFSKYNSQKIETILISEDQLIIHYGRTKNIWCKMFNSQANDVNFQTCWTKIDLEVQENQLPKIFAQSKGVNVEIGKLLPHNERSRLVNILQSSLVMENSELINSRCK